MKRLKSPRKKICGELVPHVDYVDYFVIEGGYRGVFLSKMSKAFGCQK